MLLTNIQNLLLSQNYQQLKKIIESCENKLFKKGIKLFCVHKLSKKIKAKYNPYFYFLINKNMDNVLTDLKKIDDLYSNYYLGIYYFNDGEYDEAINYFTKFTSPCYLSYMGQINIEKGSLDIGIELLDKSQEFVLSSFYLANCYSNSYGVKYDFNKCESLYRHCVNLKYIEAYYNLAALYLSTDQIKYGPKYCLDLMEEAARTYHTKSFMYVLYYYYARNIEKFNEWFEYLKLSNNKELIELIAKDFRNGFNFDKDEDRASLLYNL